ncbi:MAG: photosystem II stability/assembly factor-like uncharacterized protein [Saprospiraceae bacterium]|jgi:photosystem II stability/assembly factor-like uncharacterized protein
MKPITTLLVFLFSLNLATTQTTEELFSLPGLKYVVDITAGENIYDVSRFYVGSFLFNGNRIHLYEKNQGFNLFLYVDGQKVYRTEPGSSSEPLLVYDFGLQEGETMKMFQGIDHVLDLKETVKFEDGLDRIVMNFSRPDIPDSTVTIIEGIGYTNYGFGFIDETFAIQLRCVTSDNSLILIEDDFSLDECENRSCLNMRGEFTIEGNNSDVSLEYQFYYYDSISMTFGDGIYFDEFVDSYTYAEKGCYKIEVGIFNKCGDSYYYSDFYDNCGEPRWFSQSLNLFEISFVNKDVGYGIYADKLYKTIDGGNNWTKLDIPKGEYELYSVYFSDLYNGVLSTQLINSNNNKEVLLTSDGGMTWQIVEVEGGKVLGKAVINNEGLVFGNDNNGYYRMKSDGSDFKKLEIPSFLYGKDVRVAQDGTIVIGIEIDEEIQVFNSYLFISTDAGDSFNEIDLFFDDEISSYFFFDSEHGFIGMEGDLYETKDGGVTWENVYSYHQDGKISILSFFNDQNGIMIIDGEIHITTDGGKNWFLEDCKDFGLSKAQAVDGEYFGIAGSVYKRTVDPDSDCYVLDIEELQLSLEIELVPNPTHDYFSIIGLNDDVYRLKIRSTSGVLLKDIPVLNQENINISKFPKGLYFITVYKDEFIKSLKLIKY